jgi:hypothetical protein
MYIQPVRMVHRVLAAYSLCVSPALSKADSQIDCSAYELKRALSPDADESGGTTFAAVGESVSRFLQPQLDLLCLPRRNFAMMASLVCHMFATKRERDAKISKPHPMLAICRE